MKFNHIKPMFILLASVILCGCRPASTGNDTPATDTDKSEKVIQTSDDKDADKDDTKEPGKDPEKIFFSYQNNDLELKNPSSSALMMEGNYYSISLDSSDSRLYPQLSNALDTYNAAEEKRVTDAMSSAAPDMIELQGNGFDGSGDIFTDIYLLRADEKAFSFCISDYSFLGGAHGFTQYYGYCYDPKTGERINFSDIFKSTYDLPGIIVDELLKQNEDLIGYFKECPSDKENLLADIPSRLENEAKGLAWALDYDGIWFYFEDYAMGAYVAGSQAVKVSFSDYPEIFTNTFVNYKADDVPDIKTQYEKKEDAPKTEIQASDPGKNSADDNDPFFGLWIGSFKERQEALDLVDKLDEQGIEAYSIYTPEYENLNKEPYWCVTIGRSGSEPEAQAYIDAAQKAGFPDAYVKYTGNRLCKRIYCYIYAGNSLEITPSKVTMNEVPVEELSGTSYSEGPATLTIDSATVFDKSCNMQPFTGYKEGMSVLDWFNKANEPDLLGVFDVSITGTHVDGIYGSYLWD